VPVRGVSPRPTATAKAYRLAGVVGFLFRQTWEGGEELQEQAVLLVPFRLGESRQQLPLRAIAGSTDAVHRLDARRCEGDRVAPPVLGIGPTRQQATPLGVAWIGGSRTGLNGRRRGRTSGHGGLRRRQGGAARPHQEPCQGSRRRRILTNVVVPGFLNSERNRRLVRAPVLEQWASRTPTGRLATEEEVARVAVFLASPATGGINGAAIRVSGGG
jgi:Enoyl-(Acyl carrier protein) reductase